jgi:hypothetical protein
MSGFFASAAYAFMWKHVAGSSERSTSNGPCADCRVGRHQLAATALVTGDEKTQG